MGWEEVGTGTESREGRSCLASAARQTWDRLPAQPPSSSALDKLLDLFSFCLYHCKIQIAQPIQRAEDEIRYIKYLGV